MEIYNEELRDLLGGYGDEGGDLTRERLAGSRQQVASGG